MAGRVKGRENQRVINKAVYLALGVTMEGQKEPASACGCRRTREPAFWLSVFTELQNRGMKDGFIAWVDGLSGLPEAIETVFPQTRVQLCMVHLVRNSLRSVSYKHRKAVATDLKAIYSAATEAEAEFHLELKAREMGPAVFDQQSIVASAVGARDPAVRLPRGHSASVISTTNATLVGQHDGCRKVTRHHRIFPPDEAVYKVLSLAMHNIAKKWTRPLRDWNPA